MKKPVVIRKNDVLLLTAVLFICLAAAVGRLIAGGAHGNGMILVTSDGREIGRYPLSADTEFVVEAPDGGSNTVVIRDGGCYVREADCPDGICMRRGRIDKNGESIVCLPHRLVILVSGGESGADTIAE